MSRLRGNISGGGVTMKSLYDHKYLKSTLYTINAELQDLKNWSAYNDDKYQEDIDRLQEIITAMRKENI